MNINKNRQQNGITLIALVITIIVMLILVAVTISMAVNGGLFDYAGKAVGDTNNAMQAEQKLENGAIQVDGVWYDSIDDYLAGKPAVFSYDETAKDENGLLTANATYTSGEYTAVIPKGFAIVSGLKGTTTIADGLVITDELDAEGNSIGNEFVWIPVVLEGKTQAEKEVAFEAIRKDGYYNGSLQTLVSGKSVTEPFAKGYTDEEKEYKEMRTSVIENGGFYIGRYEAGSTTARIDKENGTTDMVIKRDAYPYNYVGWGLTMSDYTNNVIYSNKDQGLGAFALSKAMYANKDVGVTSTLCYGIQWDAMLKFLGKDTETDSTEWGNYQEKTVTIDRKTARWTSNPNSDAIWTLIETTVKEKTNSEGVLLTTGASDEFAMKNIFDVAGNICEWTNEGTTSSGRVRRGGGFSGEGIPYPPSFRFSNVPWGSYVYLGFRPSLYVK